MAVAMVYPDPKRGVHSEFRNGTEIVSKAWLSNARTVLAASTAMAANVVIGNETGERVIRRIAV